MPHRMHHLVRKKEFLCSQIEGQHLLVSSASVGSSLSRPALWLLPIFAGLVLVCAVALATGNLLSIGFDFEKNYNEGWNVYNAQRLIDHELVYDENYWRVNNYPILSFIVVAGVNLLVHDLLLSGRLIALVSFVAVGILAAVTTRRLGGDRVDALFGGACALGFCYSIAPAWVGVDDPQTLSEAMMLGGLVSYLSGRRDRLSLSRTALLVVLGGFVKHNVVAIPLAITLDIAFRSPRRLLFWLGCCAVTFVCCLMLTDLVAGGTFIDHLMSPRSFTWYRARYHLMKYLRFGEFPLAVMLFYPRGLISRAVLGTYGGISIFSATIFSGFEGASYNMFQDAAVFLAIAAAVTLHELRKHMIAGASAHSRLAKAALIAVPLLLAQPVLARSPESLLKIYHLGDMLEIDRRAAQSFSTEASYISAMRGPAICESLLLCYRAGQPFMLDPFNSRQYILAGRIDQNVLIQRIAAKEFAVVQLRADICDSQEAGPCHIRHRRVELERFSDDILHAIDHYYHVAWRAQDGTFYAPK